MQTLLLETVKNKKPSPFLSFFRYWNALSDNKIAMVYTIAYIFAALQLVSHFDLAILKPLKIGNKYA